MSGIFGSKQRRQPAVAVAADQKKQLHHQTTGAQPAPRSQMLPDAQQHLAALVPTHGLTLTGVIFLVLLLTGMAVAPAVAREGFGHELLAMNESYATSIGVLRQSLGLHTQATLAGWLTQAFLFLAAASALIVRALQRHRRDGPGGRFRVWGWLAVLWITAAATTAVPLGPAVAAALLTLTATPFGPQGLGWWVTCGSTALLLTAPLAVLRLREKLPTALTLGSGLLLWAGATGCIWHASKDPRLLPLANAAWLAGSGLIFFSMLLAVRGTIREIHGLCRPPAAKPKKLKSAKARIAHQNGSAGSSTTDSVTPPTATPAFEDTAIDFQEVHELGDESATSFGSEAEDFSDQAPRRLSKSERRRLRKLSRRGQAA